MGRRGLAVLALLIAASAGGDPSFNVGLNTSAPPAAAGGCQFQALGGAFATTNTAAPAWPTHLADDIAILVVETANEAVTFSAANGFTAVADSPQGTGTAAGTTATRLSVFWARATSAAMSAPAINDAGNHIIGRLMTFRGCDTSGDPWDVTAGDVASTASTTVTIPGDTTTAANTLVLAIATNRTDTATDQFSTLTNGDLGSVTILDEVQTSTPGNGGGYIVVSGTKAAAGAYGATSGTLATTSTQGRISIALNAQ
jgi:hypothetical protein